MLILCQPTCWECECSIAWKPLSKYCLWLRPVESFWHQEAHGCVPIFQSFSLLIALGLEVVESSGWFADLAWYVKVKKPTCW